MGLFSNLKNFVTGGSAEVTLEIPDKPMRGHPFVVHIKAVVGDSSCQVKKVYLKVRGVEHVKIKGVETAEKKDDTIKIQKKTIRHQDNTFKLDEQVAAELELQAGETYTWEAQVEIPENVLPTFEGKNARHEWRMIAGMDMRGNDPDTGWQTFTVE